MDGVLILDKPKDLTSYDCIRKLKRLYRFDKIGHAGTLDPFATGVLPVLINKGTKVAQFLLDSSKAYLATLQLGQATDTDDIEGRVVQTMNLPSMPESEIISIIEGLRGEMIQIPPMFSAIKHQGVPLYKYARQGQEIKTEPRAVEILAIKVIRLNLPEITFEVECSKGTYIRTLAKDIAILLGSCGHLSQLRRIRSGPFTIDQAVPLSFFEPTSAPLNLVESLVSLRTALAGLVEVTVSEAMLAHIADGRAIGRKEYQPSAILNESRDFVTGEYVKILSPTNELVAIAMSLVDKKNIERFQNNDIILKIKRLI
jgi:tRNA pseudouridine55 synthase